VLLTDEKEQGCPLEEEQVEVAVRVADFEQSADFDSQQHLEALGPACGALNKQHIV
jgi:hypothetical protein